MNQQDALISKYYPKTGMRRPPMYLIWLGYHWIQDMWEGEGKPEPQELIPVMKQEAN